MNHNLKVLADKLGIARHFSDAGMNKREYDVDENIIKFFCKQFGYAVNTSEDVDASLQKLEDNSWKKTIDSIVIVHQDNMSFKMSLHNGQATEKLTAVIISAEGKTQQDVELIAEDTHDQKVIGRRIYRQVLVTIKQQLEYGYYHLEISCGKDVYRTVLAVAPDSCYTNPVVESGKIWGYSLQLYSLKSRRNWGVGDFSDLRDFVGICHRSGADVIGLNPLNVLFHDFPENASPYSSISRLFLNPIYIDVEQVPLFTKAMKKQYDDEIAEAKKGEIIDYTKVYNLKIKALSKLFEKLESKKKYNQEFASFKAEKGVELEMLATYQALYQVQSKTVWGGWMAWEKDLQNPHSLKVVQFKTSHQKQIEFFKFLQFEADRQLKLVYDEVRKLGLKIGLYRDLPVGVCKDSAELWADRYVFMNKSGAGAPPDAFFPCGQKWCLGAFNPLELKHRAYEPYLKILRANMAYAGALRIDHVMGLMRLFMIPDDGKDGTYIHYNFDDMLSLLALESHLHQCVIVGESIGNVPYGFLDTLSTHKIYSIGVLWSERWDGGYGDFKMSRDYPAEAFVSVGTHDMTPLKMWWFGYEIELMKSLGMLTDKERLETYKRRENDRRMLLAALDFNQVWSADKMRQADYLYGEGYPQGIEEAVHRLVAKAPSKVVMLQLEDIFGVDKLQNLPGTDRDKYPNWRHRLPIDLEDIETSENYRRNVSAVKSVR